jgi:hypothetical protein
VSARAAALVAELGLTPHPEGGHFRETFRSSSAVDPRDGRPLRAALTGIYCLYAAGERSRWHRVESDEVWTHLEGGPLRLWLFDPAGDAVSSRRLSALADGGEPQQAVRAGLWQAAEPLGDYTLGACFVGPGFDFADFRLLDADPAARAAIALAAPELLRLA